MGDAKESARTGYKLLRCCARSARGFVVSPKKKTILNIFDEKLLDFGTRFAGPEGRLLRLPGAPIYVGMQNYVGMLRNWNKLHT